MPSRPYTPLGRTVVTLIARALVSWAVIGASGAVSSCTVTERFGEVQPGPGEFRRMRYFDTGQVSLNDRCPVRKGRLNPAVRPVYVNGRPIGFC